MRKRERVIYFYDVRVQASCRVFDAPRPISVSEVFRMLSAVPRENRVKSIHKDTQLLYVEKIRSLDDGSTYELLINKSDKSLSDPVFTNPELGGRRIVEKEEGEGQDFSIHMILKTPRDELGTGLVLLEFCSGLGFSYVEKLLNEVLREAKNIFPDAFIQNHPDGSVDKHGNPKKINVNYSLDFVGHVSDDFTSDINNGKITSFELITEREQNHNFDENGFVVEKNKSVFLKVSDRAPNKLATIRSTIFNKREEYEFARIKFLTPGGLSRSVEIQANAIDQAAGAYVRREAIDDFDVDLKASYSDFCDEIITEMKRLLD